MNIFFIFNYGEIWFYNKRISRSKEKYIYFFLLEHYKTDEHYSSNI